MRAVVESPRMTELAGVNAGRVSAFAWILSSMMAALAGVLLAPLYSQLDPQNFTVLLVWGVAGAVIGRFASLPLALVGRPGPRASPSRSIAGYMPAGVIANGLRPSLPFVVLLVFLPLARQRQLDDPLSGCDPPSSAVERPTSGYRSAVHRGRRRTGTVARRRAVAPAPRGAGPASRTTGLLTRRPTATFAWAVAALAIVSALTWVPPDWLLTMNQGVAFAVIFLSLTLLTGMTGQISLCQATFAGLGGFMAGQLANHFGLPDRARHGGRRAAGRRPRGAGGHPHPPPGRPAAGPGHAGLRPAGRQHPVPQLVDRERGGRGHRAPPVGRAGELRRRQAVLPAVAGRPGRVPPAW